MSRRILVIDDEQGIRAALGQLLEYEGYEVHTLANAADGIAEYQKWRPHLAQTQNWSGVHGVPSPGSRISISAPQR